MSDPRTMARARATITLGDAHYLLAQGQDYEALKTDIVAAIRSGGRFVEFIGAGNRRVAALVTATTHVILTLEAVDSDDSDDSDAGVEDDPFDAFFEGI